MELETLQSWRHTLGCDHDPLLASFSIPNRPFHKKKRKPPGTNCGRWNVNLTQVLEEIQSPQDELIVHEQRDVLVQDLEALARTSCNRPSAYRYQDSPEIKNYQAATHVACDDSRKLANRIVKFAKQGWLVGVCVRQLKETLQLLDISRTGKEFKACAPPKYTRLGDLKEL